jgi:hypothetical protein
MGTEVSNQANPGDNTEGTPVVDQQGTAFHEELANDRIAAANDRTRVAAAGDQQVVDPVDLIKQAQADGAELLQLGGRQKWDRIQVRDAQTGQMKEMTVEERMLELKANIKAGTERAIAIADALPQDQITKNMEENARKLDTLTKQMGVNLQTLKPEQLQAMANTAQGKELIGLLQEREQINLARFMPAMTRIVAANFKAEGMTSPEGQMATPQNPVPKPSPQEISDAMTLLNQAARSGDNGVPGQQSVGNEVARSQMFLETSAKVTGIYAENQQDRGKSIVRNIQEAQQLAAQGKAEEAGAKLKAAYDTAETIDYKFIAAQLREPHNQNNPQVKQALIDIINNGFQARTNYAKHLRDTGRFEDALPIVVKAEADTPEFAAADPTFGKLKADAMFGKTVPQGELENHQLKFQEAIQNKDFTAAQKEIDFLRGNYQKTIDQLDKGDKKLQEEQTKVKQQLADLEKQQIDQKQKDIEKERLNKELEILEQNLKMNDEFRKQYPMIQYLAGVLAFSKGDNKDAHALFEEVKKTSPEIAGNKEMKLDDLLEETREKGWLESNWNSIKKGLCIGAAVLAGVAVGAALFWTGPGAALAGTGTALGVAGALGISFAGGAVAGSLAGVGTKYVTEGFDASKISGRDFLEYGVYGGAAGAAAITGPLLGAAGVGAGVSSTAGTLAVNVGTRVAPAAVFGYGSTGGNQLLQVAYDGKSWGDAAKDTAIWGTVSTAAYALTPGLSNSYAAGGNAFREATAEGVQTSLRQQMMSTALRQNIGHAGRPLVGWTLVGETGFPVLGQTYRQYSPWRVPVVSDVFGRPNAVPLDPSNPKEEEEMWNRYYGATK